jgi:hypothetical protein
MLPSGAAESAPSRRAWTVLRVLLVRVLGLAGERGVLVPLEDLEDPPGFVLILVLADDFLEPALGVPLAHGARMP